MKEVEKKQKKEHSRLWVLLLIPLAAGLITLYFAVIQPAIQKRQVSLPESTFSEEELTLTDYADDGLFSIYIAPRDDEPFTLAYINGSFVLEGDDTYPIRSNILYDLTAYAASVTAMDIIYDLSDSEPSGDGYQITKADFGLQPPQYSVIIRYLDGNSISLSLGNAFMDGVFTRYYMSTDRNDLIYAISSDMYDAFAWHRRMLHTVDQPSLDASLIDRVQLAGEINCTLARSGDFWRLFSPAPYPADSEKAETLFSQIGSMRFSSWEGAAEELALSDYGLDEPRLSISITMADMQVEGYDEQEVFHSVVVEGDTHTLLIGQDASETEGVSFYCCYDGTVYIGTYFTLGFFLDVDPAELYQLNPISYAANALDELRFESGNTYAEYRIELIENVLQNGELETDPDTGELVYSLSVTKEGQAVDADTFLVWYNRLTQLTPTAAAATGWEAAGEPLYTITLSFNGQNREVRFFRYDPLNLAIWVDGTVVYILPEERMNGLENCP